MPRHLHQALSRPRWAASALAAALSACSLTPPPPTPALPQPTLTPAAYHHAVGFPGGSAELTPAEAASLRRFAASLPEGRGLAATLTAPAGTAGHPLDPRLAQRRVAAVAGLLRQSGIAATAAIAADRTAAGGGVEVTVRTEEVVLPGCPDWSRSAGYDPGNLPLSNLGCANALNLGLMVADPADLAGRRPLGPADGTHAAEAVVRYRTDKVTPLKTETVQ